MDLNTPLQLDDTTELRAIFDPALRCFSAQLWRNGEPAGLFGEPGEFTHPDDILEEVDGFLTKHGESPLSRSQEAKFGGMLIMAKGGPDAALLTMAMDDPESFIGLS